MADYRTPFPGMLAGAMELALNQVLALDDQAPALLKPLDGKVLALELKGLALTLYFGVGDDRINVSTGNDGEEPDAVVRGTPASLFSMAMPDWDNPAAKVEISGDAELARRLDKLVRQLDPDWEAPLTRIFGEIIGHQLAAQFRGGMAWARRSLRSGGETVSEYLREESRILVTAAEVDRFMDEVDDLRDAVDRLEVRIKRASGQ